MVPEAAVATIIEEATPPAILAGPFWASARCANYVAEGG